MCVCVCVRVCVHAFASPFYRDELSSMTDQLTEQHRSNCTKAVNEVCAAKDKEIDELKASTANKMAELHQQVHNFTLYHCAVVLDVSLCPSTMGK